MKNKVRHLVRKPGAKGPRWYWQPSATLRAAGWRTQRLRASTDEEARDLAERINDELDQARANSPAGKLPRLGHRNHVALARLAQKVITADRPVLRLSRRTARNATARSHSVDTELFVYVMGTPDGLQKIGVSRQPEERRVTLRASSGQDLRLWFAASGAGFDAKEVETLAHTRLAGRRQVGEWFDVTPRRAIDAVLAGISIARERATAPEANTPATHVES